MDLLLGVRYIGRGKLNNILLKAPTITPPTVITTLGTSGDTSIGNGNLRVVNQLIENGRALE